MIMNKLLFDYLMKKRSLGIVVVGVAALTGVEAQAQGTPVDSVAHYLSSVNNSVLQETNPSSDTGRLKFEYLNNVNAYQYIPHNSLKYITMEAVGGGGVGGRADESSEGVPVSGRNLNRQQAAGGGGGGAYSRSYVALDPTSYVYNVWVGIGGNYQTNNNGESNRNGGTSRVDKQRIGNATEKYTLVGALGGKAGNGIVLGAGGEISTTTAPFHENSSYSIGYPTPIMFKGGNGGEGDINNTVEPSGAGGGAAGSMGAGHNANYEQRGEQQLNYGGFGADGVGLGAGITNVGKSPEYNGAELYGGGGSGGIRAASIDIATNPSPGGDGASGVVIMTYSPINRVEGNCNGEITVIGANFVGSDERPVRLFYKKHEDLQNGTGAYVEYTAYNGTANPPTHTDLTEGQFYVVSSDKIIVKLKAEDAAGGVISLWTDYGQSKFYYLGKPTDPESITTPDDNYVICHIDAIPLTVNGGVNVAGTKFQWFIGDDTQTAEQIIAADNMIAETDVPMLEYDNFQDDLTGDKQRIVVRKVLTEGCNITTKGVFVDLTYTFRKFTGNDTTDSEKWQLADNWAPKMIPTIENCVYITDARVAVLEAGNSTNGAGFAKTLTVQTSGDLYLAKGSNLIVKEEIKHIEDTNNSDPEYFYPYGFYVAEGANLIQIDNKAFEGEVVVERISKGVTKYDHTYWGAPVQTTFDDIVWFKQGTPNYAEVYNPETFDTDITDEMQKAFEWNPLHADTGTWVELGLNSNSNSMETTKGYMIFPPVSFGPEMNVGQLQNKNSLMAQFVGTPNNGDYTATAYGGKKTLLSNPYPSAIGVEALLRRTRVGSTSMTDGVAIMIWNKGQVNGDDGDTPADHEFYYDSTFITYTLAGSTNKDAHVIPSAQGFLADVSGQNRTIRFSNSTRYIGADIENASGYDNEQFYKTAASEEDELELDLHRIWLSLQNGNRRSNAMMGYTNLSLDERDGMDAKYYNPAETVKLYTTLQDDLFAIQTYALPFEDTDVFNLGYEVSEPGTYTLKLEGQDGLFDGQDIYLKDKVANVLHNLKDGTYEFLSSNGIFQDRFEIVFRSELSVDPIAEQNANFIVYTKDNNVNLQTAGFDMKDVYIYDVLGRELYSKQNVNAEAHQATILGANQILVVKVVTSEGTTLVKKIQK